MLRDNSVFLTNGGRILEVLTMGKLVLKVGIKHVTLNLYVVNKDTVVKHGEYHGCLVFIQ